MIIYAKGSEHHASLVSGLLIVVFSTTCWFYARGEAWSNSPNALGFCTFVTCESEGQILYALQGDNATLFRSTNSGLDWVKLLPGINASSVSASDDGAEVALPYGGFTTNGGDSFSTAQYEGPVAKWSGSGNTLVICANGANGLYITTNNGESWLVPSSMQHSLWGFVALSADGRVIAAADGVPGPLRISTNAGFSWTDAPVTNRYWTALTCSADGSKIAAGVREASSGLVVTRDTGGTWSYPPPRGLVPTNSSYFLYHLLQSSADGSLLLANMGGGLFISRNFGDSWVLDEPASFSGSAACSPDGTTLAAVAGGNIVIQQLAPPLAIAASGSQLTLSWPAPSSQYTLQQISDLASTNWLIVTNALTVTNYRNHVTLPAPSSGNVFYRLSRQGA